VSFRPWFAEQDCLKERKKENRKEEKRREEKRREEKRREEKRREEKRREEKRKGKERKEKKSFQPLSHSSSPSDDILQWLLSSRRVKIKDKET
jgi:hypothetical protein